MALEVYVTGSEEDDGMEDVDWISLLIKAKSPNLTSLVDNAYCLEWHFPSEMLETPTRTPNSRRSWSPRGVFPARRASACSTTLAICPLRLSVLGHTAINACILASICSART